MVDISGRQKRRYYTEGGQSHVAEERLVAPTANDVRSADASSRVGCEKACAREIERAASQRKVRIKRIEACVRLRRCSLEEPKCDEGQRLSNSGGGIAVIFVSWPSEVSTVQKASPERMCAFYGRM